MRRRTLILGTAALAATGAGLADRARVLGTARGAVPAPTGQIMTRHGPMSYALVRGDASGLGGAAPPAMILPVLMLHGTGGGHDQGLALAGDLPSRGWTVVAPSRFGYPGTPMPAGVVPRDGPDSEADALADLLDALGVARVAVIGASAGANPALAFALRHPARTAALVALVPATHVPGRPAPPPPDAVAEAIITRVLRSDTAVWAALRLAPDRMLATLLATDPALVAAAEPSEQARTRLMLHGILPVSLRADGLLYDARLAADPPAWDLSAITAPTLALSAEDDLFGTAAAARYIGRAVPGARTRIYPAGGHILIGHFPEALSAIDGFLRAAA